jgi:SAM-dependent methyltransferase
LTTELVSLPALKSERTTVLRDLWDAHAAEWIDWVRAPNRQDSYWRFHRRRFLSLVPEPGRLTLDIGCGEGRVARDLKLLGHKVLGVDWSLTMCRAAANYPEDPTAVVATDAARLPLADESVDCVVAFMSLQDIDEMRGTIKEIARVLADGRKLALAIVHPMYSASGINPDGNLEIKRSYLTPELCISKDRRDDLTMTFYREHRPLQDYVNALLKAGFSIEGLLELADDDERDSRYHVPMFLDIVAVRKPRKEGATSSARQPGNTHHVIERQPPRHGHDRQTGQRKPDQRRPGHAPLKSASSTQRLVGVYISACLGFIVVVFLVLALFRFPLTRLP